MSTKLSQAGLAFLQRRVSLFGLMVGGLGLIFLVFRVADILWRERLQELREPDVLAHLAAVLLFLSIWWLCRSGTRSHRFVNIVESIGFVGGSAAYQVMGGHLPLEENPQMTVLLALTYTIVARAVYVPSSALRTLGLGVVSGVSLVATTYAAFLRVDAATLEALRAEWGEVQPEQYAARFAAATGVWWILSTILATAINQVVHGLRKDVREARRLGQYVLEEKIGEGGMGVVYLARHSMLKRPTAVKLLQPEATGEAALARFEREVQLTSRLTHPNTVTVFDYGRTRAGVFYYAMELLDGASLEAVVRLDGAQPPERVVHVLHQVAGALAEAHGIGLIHRDIKPANIILCEQGGAPDVPKVVDFGLVKDLTDDASVELTQASTITGTPLYISPEAIQSAEAVDARSDLYALGAVGYYLLTGDHVFKGKSVVEVCGHHLHATPESPSRRLGAPVPEDVETVLLECLAKEPAERPQTADALRERLMKCESFGRWTPAQARRWWSDNAERLRQQRQANSGKGKDATYTAPPSGSLFPSDKHR